MEKIRKIEKVQKNLSKNHIPDVTLILATAVEKVMLANSAVCSSHGEFPVGDTYVCTYVCTCEYVYIYIYIFV